MKTTTIFFALAMLAMAACQTKNDAVTEPDIHLETAVWQLTTILVDPIPRPVPDSLPVPLTVKFSEGKIEGFGGCNGFGGEYTKHDNHLSIGGLVHTEMYCEGRSQWEQLFLERLEASRTYRIEGEKLEIQSGDMGGLVFRLNWKKRKGE